MMGWSNNCGSVLPLFLLLLGSSELLPFSSASATAVVGSDLRSREANPQEWVPPQTVTITETTRYTLTALTTLTIDPRVSTIMVTSGATSTTKSTTTQTSTFTSTTTTTITPTPTATPKNRRQVSQQPSTITVTTTVWAFPDVTITSTISFTAPISLLTTVTSMPMTMTTDIVTESTATTSIVTATATASTTSAAGRGKVESKKGPHVGVIIGVTFAVSIVVALLVFLYVRFVRGKEDTGVSRGEAGATGVAGANKRRYTPYAAKPKSAIKFLLDSRKQPYNPVPAGDTNLLSSPYNPTNTSRSASTSFPGSYPHQAQLHQNPHSHIPRSPPPAPTFPTSAAPLTYLPVSPTPPRLPQIHVARADTTSTISSFSSSNHSDPPVPIYPLTAAGARLPPTRKVQFHALTTAGEERRMSTPPQEEPVEPDALWYGPSRSGSGSSGGGGVSVRRKPLP